MTRAAGEPLLGTAAVGTRYVFVSWPKGQWGKKALEAPGLAPLAAWGQAFDARHPGKTVIRLFAEPADSQAIDVKVFPAAVGLSDVPLAELPTRLDGLFEDIEAGRAPTGVQPLGRTIAVCTHGKHDQCCARYGQGVFNALCEHAATLEAEVVEASHLGGHRFAATLIDFEPGTPGRMYGQVDVADVPTLVEHFGREAVWLERYRGRVDLKATEQIAEAAALGAGAQGPLSFEALAEDRVEVRWTGGAIEVPVERREIHGLKACGRERETIVRIAAVS